MDYRKDKRDRTKMKDYYIDFSGKYKNISDEQIVIKADSPENAVLAFLKENIGEAEFNQLYICSRRED